MNRNCIKNEEEEEQDNMEQEQSNQTITKISQKQIFNYQINDVDKHSIRLH